MNKNQQIAKKMVQHILTELAELKKSGEDYYQLSPEKRNTLANVWMGYFEHILDKNFQICEVESYTAFYDGSATPNPGIMRIGGYIQNGAGDTIWTLSKQLGQGTNNQAEYLALLEVTKKLNELNAKNVEIFGDSMLSVKQVNGEWKIKDNTLKNLCKMVKGNLAKIDNYSLCWVRRNENAMADRLSKG
jgi:ribonuclease HI